MAGFRFDATTHVYWQGTRQLPAISTILRAQHDRGPWFTAEHLARGTAVHAATLAFDLGSSSVQFLTAQLPGEWRGFFTAYVEFRQQAVCRWAALEQPRMHRKYRFAGTPDRVGWINGQLAILEIKTGSPADWHALQTAAQDVLIEKPDRWGVRRRFAVYLAADGRFKLRSHPSAADYLKFFQTLQDFHTQPQELPTEEGRD